MAKVIGIVFGVTVFLLIYLPINIIHVATGHVLEFLDEALSSSRLR